MSNAQKKPTATTQQPAAAQSEPESELVRSLRQQERAAAIQEATTRRAAIADDLADARILAETARQRLAVATTNWDANGEMHTSEEAVRLEARQREATATAAQVAELQSQLDAVDVELGELQRNEQRERGSKLAAEVWPSMVRKVAAQARAFHAVLVEQAKIREQLFEAGAWGLVDVEGLVMSDVMYLDPCPSITTWLEAVERAGVISGE